RRGSQQQNSSGDQTIVRIPYLRCDGNGLISHAREAPGTGISPQILLRKRHRKRLGTSHLSSLIFNVATRMVTRTAYTTVNESVFSRVPESPSAPFHTYSMKRESGFKSNEVPMAAERADRKGKTEGRT